MQLQSVRSDLDLELWGTQQKHIEKLTTTVRDSVSPYRRKRRINNEKNRAPFGCSAYSVLLLYNPYSIIHSVSSAK